MRLPITRGTGLPPSCRLSVGVARNDCAVGPWCVPAAAAGAPVVVVVDVVGAVAPLGAAVAPVAVVTVVEPVFEPVVGATGAPVGRVAPVVGGVVVATTASGGPQMAA